MRSRKMIAVTISAFLLISGASATGAAPEAKEVYIIKFADNVNLDNEIAALKAGGGDIRFEYRNVFQGAAVAMNSAQANGLSRNPRIEIIEKDAIATTQVTQSLNLDTSLWGLDRIDQNRGTDGSYSYVTNGTNVNVYVLDTGIDLEISDFGGRVKQFRNFTGDGVNSDCGWHGTHVAGTIGSATYGVAKGVNLFPYKVLDCSGSGAYSWIISALNDIAGTNSKPAVVNMSLGGPKSTSLNSAVANLTNKGYVVVVAAGNSNTNACNSSPASAPSAITVGASTSADTRASFSNTGKCVDIFAPGQGIKSFVPGGSTAVWDGTSMASPHVAGVAARVLSLNPGASVSAITAEILNTATSNVLTGIGSGSPNKLLFRDGTK